VRRGGEWGEEVITGEMVLTWTLQYLQQPLQVLVWVKLV
jgi:hypothetical protein